MGMTPLEGLVMGTRSGDVDPGALLHIMRSCDLAWTRWTRCSTSKAGCWGCRNCPTTCANWKPRRKADMPARSLASRCLCHRLARYIGGLAMSLRRLDAVVFTGGIGENSVRMRAMTVTRLRALGLVLDEASNAVTTGGTAGLISATGSSAQIAVVPTNEEWMIVCDTAALADREHGSLLESA